ncbi:MAG: Cobalamin import system permease protein BtuC [Methanoregulaceae archaeon PtaB.Bin108]|nr:MAG: Cobalamin import system permease protein BtuC [Methanoregulaceae archaeon PtaB.Bin108]OPY47229.1 MAG: Cobalamin import system permease protein BtuC [Methanoregulaceae archaeon PtaU1.Bin222]
MHPRLNLPLTIVVLCLILALAMLLGVSIGESDIPFSRTMAIIGSPLFPVAHDWTPAEESIILFIRLPRVLLAALVGASLAICGAVLQSLFRNPMADPFLLGISNGAALGASLVLVTGLAVGSGIFGVPVAAFAFGLLTIIIVYELARVGNRVPVTSLLLCGIAVAAFMSAGTSFLLFVSGENLHQVVFWLLGGIAGRGWEYVGLLLPFVIGGSVFFFSLTRPLNALMFGEESAQYLGIDVERLKKLILVAISLVTGAAVSVSGIIGFVGLITPHMVRLWAGPNHRALLPLSFLVGAILLVLADLTSRLILAPNELPIGIITALCGAPFFAYLLRRRNREA